MSKELKIMEPKQYDDEIDLYELIEMLIKNKNLIMITTFIVILLSIFGAYYENKRSSKVTTFYVKEYFINRDSLKTNILDDSGNTIGNSEGIIDPSKIFLKNDRIDSMFEIDELKKMYKGNSEYNQKRDFLNSFFKVEEKEIDKNERKTMDFISKNTILIVKTPMDLNNKKIEEIYEKYEKNLKDSSIVMDSNKKVDIYSISDVYIEKIQRQSKAKLILAVGVVMGVFLGIMAAFLKEFVDGYKRRYKKQ